jgi:hypothetical protein
MLNKNLWSCFLHLFCQPASAEDFMYKYQYQLGFGFIVWQVVKACWIQEGQEIVSRIPCKIFLC